MPPSKTHPLVLFSLKPINQRAFDVLANPINGHLVSIWGNGTRVLDIGHIHSISGNTTTLATLGRNADIIVGGSSISRVQCSFEIDPDTNIVMLYDRSHSLSTQVFGDDAMPFQYGRPRKVVVHQTVNTVIGMGGEKRDLVLFELHWYYDPASAMEKVKDRQSAALEDNPRLARTIDEADTSLPSRRETRPHTSGPRQSQIRYTEIGEALGSGAFGTVHQVVDVDTGRLMALKVLKFPPGESERAALLNLVKREVEVLSRLNHPHIVDYISFEGEPEVKIFMGLKQGTLHSLVENGVMSNQLGETVLHQMLQALDCLATEDIIHRDIKPENILYVLQSSQYCFQLGDFGLSNRASIALTFAGSPIFMAPEIFQRGRRQTHKVDVWSLFVTMLWTLDISGFRQKSKRFSAFEDAPSAVLSVAAKVPDLQAMASFNPEERASAAQMLIKCFKGVGLSTPRHLVPTLDNKATPLDQFRVRKARLPQTQPRSPVHRAASEKETSSLLLAATKTPQVPGSFPNP
ncbi:kinase-like domain-containing protein [Nemania diffusa]|nr:kinase-like domain-containing protein [Nemania diffusa]